tara:strand:+ start:45 stop:560 length:516 start_codon:yes stop_codon:yes gene_type:complete
MGNTASNYTIIRVTPTLSTDTYAKSDVLFTATEIPNAVKGNGGCSKLVAAYILDQSDASGSDIQLIFSEGNTALGTINATANISEGDLEALNICGYARCTANQAQSDADIDNARIHQILPGSGAGENVSPLMLLQAAAGSTSVYVQGILSSDTTPTYAADDIDLILHIQYK